jgi:hypothetical protein
MISMKEKKSAWTGLLKTFIATTFSIVLTFGTAALIDRHKQANEKRQIVLMLTYDLDNSLNQARHCDSVIQEFLKLQTQIIEDPALFEDSWVKLFRFIPTMNYTETIENIFSSNIETIHTISNVYFVEKASEFYRLRNKYYDNVVKFGDAFDALGVPFSYEDLVTFDACHYFVISSYLLADMEHLYLQCKQIMKVTDEELESFYQARQQIEAASGEKENVWDKKIPQLMGPWQEALKKSQER